MNPPRTPFNHPARWLLLTLLVYMMGSAIGLLAFLAEWFHGGAEFISIGRGIGIATYLLVAGVVLTTAFFKVFELAPSTARWARFSIAAMLPMVLAAGATVVWALNAPEMTFAHILIIIPGYAVLFGGGLFQAFRVATSSQLDELGWESAADGIQDPEILGATPATFDELDDVKEHVTQSAEARR